MPDSLYWNTVTPLLKEALTLLMESEIFEPFRLVGGTSLSLQLGHRMSDDIDLFTDEDYDSIDFDRIDKLLRESFAYVSALAAGPVGMGRSYLIGNSKTDTVKLDMFYVDKFIRNPLVIGPYRLATVDEIVAMKVNIVQRRGRKKDFWDLHEALEDYSIEAMMALHQERYPFDHDEALIRTNFIDFTKADNDLDPKCARGKFWEIIKYDFFRKLQSETN